MNVFPQPASAGKRIALGGAACDGMNMPRVMILHTGGTLGMTGTPLEPSAYSTHLEEAVPELAEIAEISSEIVCNLDSSDVGPEQWAALVELIGRERENFDGFVVIHGTDTMAYSASALAFGLRGLDRPVVFTGAQRPLSALRTDARRNLTDAVDVATRAIPEVSICFDGLLLRGCRTTKSNAHDYRGFDSPGVEPLARLGVNIEIGGHVRSAVGDFEAVAKFDSGVAVLPIWPGISPSLVDHLVAAEDLHGLVLAAYGVGTAPTTNRPLAPSIGRAVDAGVDVLVVTQSSGVVNLSMYRNSIPLAEAGAIAGGKMRVEAAVAKLMHALACEDDRESRRAYLERDVAGERS